MFEKVKEHLNEIIGIADKCPEKYQVKCFEILLGALVKPEIPSAAGVAEAAVISEADFFSRHEISPKEWQRVFHFDGKSAYSIIVGDLKVKPTVGKQERLALLLGVKNLLETGDAAISKDPLIELCERYSAYDSSKFATYIRQRKNLFLSKGKEGWALTIPGQAKAAEVIKELAQ